MILQIFSRKLHLRLVLILMQRMSILYGLVTISTTKRYLGLEIIGMFFSFADITLRSYFLCIQGETLYKQVSVTTENTGIIVTVP